MAAPSSSETPRSPEGQDESVQDRLDQDLITHQGEARKPPTDDELDSIRAGGHLGALEDENVAVIPPMSGPADLVGENDINAQGNEEGKTKVGEETIDPREELSPG